MDKSTDGHTETVKITGDYFRRLQEKDMLERRKGGEEKQREERTKKENERKKERNLARQKNNLIK